MLLLLFLLLLLQVILLGDSGVGKTSFIVKYHTNEFKAASFSATVGISLTVSAHHITRIASSANWIASKITFVNVRIAHQKHLSFPYNIELFPAKSARVRCSGGKKPCARPQTVSMYIAFNRIHWIIVAFSSFRE